MPAYALTTILCAGRELQPGDEIPETLRFNGRVRRVDVERLVAKGLAEIRDEPAPEADPSADEVEEPEPVVEEAPAPEAKPAAKPKPKKAT